MNVFSAYEVWFLTGSQHLYGEETLQQVEKEAREIASGLESSSRIPVRIVFKGVVTQSPEITAVCRQANNDPACAGLIMWMHTFSPAKMWIAGLQELTKPFVHLHTQFNRHIPWESIDMDFMNLNQSAHGGREFGFMVSRLRKNRHVIVGHWKDEAVEEKLSVWTRTAVAREAGKTMKVARFGDNMRNVAVTEGDKVEAQMKFGYSVDGYGIGDLVGYVEDVSATEVENLLQEYDDTYSVSEELGPGGEKREALREACRIELGMRCFLEDGGFSAFTTNFETLHGISQLPGLAVQRLMGDGYGFGAEGDWKTAALVRTMKIMAEGLPGGTSFMEDYTYHFEAGNMQVLGAHMLEVCPSIAAAKPSLEVHPLDIGGKSDPVRLVFDTAEGRALNASLVDMGNRFRFILNEVDVISPAAELPNLPVARVVWEPRPDLPTAATAWIYAGGAHHTGFTQALTSEHLELFAEMADIEFLTIDNHTSIREFKKELRWNEAYYR